MRTSDDTRQVRRGGHPVSHENLNPSAPARPKRVAIVLSNQGELARRRRRRRGSRTAGTDVDVIDSDEPGLRTVDGGRRRRVRPAPLNETSPHYPRADPAEVAAPVVADVLTTTAAGRWPRTPPVDA
jgi:hypothetical protein